MRKILIILLTSASILSLIFLWQRIDVETGFTVEYPRYPSEWIYNQRAYPDNYINEKAIDRAWDQYRTIKETRSNGSNGSWEQEGPLNIGGRITDIAISPDNDNVFFITAAVGGVFRTVDRGLNWEPVFDNAGRPSIGNIAIAPSNSQRVYVGTGEANGSATSGAFFGDGIYRSDDGGDSWTNIGLPESHHIGRIVVDPEDEDRVFAATTGVLYGTSQDRGLYRTHDGGESWEQVLFVSDSTACIDVAMNPVHTDTLYAAMWERRRQPWIRDYGGPTSGVWRSFDGGDTWDLLGGGLPPPSDETGRIGLAISASEPNVIYASYTTNPITNSFAGLYRSEDHGDTWEDVTGGSISDANASFGWYFGNVRVNPWNVDDVHVLGQKLYRTESSGVNWSQDFQMHVDFHAMEFSAQDPNMILCGTDGGLYISEDNGAIWQHYENLPITQFYQIEVDETLPERIYGGTQDNNTLRTLTGELDDYTSILGGDGFHVNVDPVMNSNIYAEYQWGNLFRSTNGGFNMQPALDGISPSDRTNWNTPVIISPYDSNVLYYGSNRLYRSNDRAVSWYPISDDLTGGAHPSGSMSFGTLTTIAASANDDMVIYVGSDDGKVHVTFDEGNTWNLISENLPNRYVTGLAIHPEDDMVAYVTFSGFGYLDYDPHIYKTTNGGVTWESVAGNLPDIPINDVLIQPEPYRLFVTTDIAVWYSEDDGLNWDVLGENLPPTVMAHLQLHQPTNQLFIGTFGRSIYSFDLNQLDIISVEERERKSRIEVYPSPANDYIMVRSVHFQATSYEIYDLIGKQVVTNRIAGESIVDQRIDVSALESGEYILRLINDDGVATEKFAKH